jgi:PEP-CTERM motif
MTGRSTKSGRFRQTALARYAQSGGKMKLVLLAGTASLALAASGSPAHAVPFDFTYTGSLVTFTVPTTDSYQILAFGAQGGGAGPLGGTGGRGAEIGGDFSLTGGDTLQIAVGGAGMDGQTGGGGGGTFVIGPGNTPLVIAGGGGIFGGSGQGGLTGPDGGRGGSITGDAFGGTGGNGGDSGGGGGGGGGFFSAGATAGTAGGGGSFDGGTDQILIADFQTGNGEVMITELATAVPEPATIALLGAGLIRLAAVRRRKPPVG